MSHAREESSLLRPPTTSSINRGNTSLAIPLSNDVERSVNYGSADLSGATGLLFEITRKHPIFLHDFIDFLIDKLNNDPANADTNKHIQQLKYLDTKIEPDNYFSIDSYNVCIKVLKIIVFELNIFEEGAIDKALLDKSLIELRIRIFEKHSQEIFAKSDLKLALVIALIGSTPALLAFLVYAAHFLSIPAGSNDGYQCFPCNNSASCFNVNTQDNRSFLPVEGYTALTYVSGALELVAALPIGFSLFMGLSYLDVNMITLNKIENLIESHLQYFKRVAANIAGFGFLLFNIIVAPMAAYLYYRASDKIYYTYDQYMRFVNCSTQDSNLTFTFCQNFSDTIACNFNWSAAKQLYNNQNKEVFFDIGLSTALTLYSLLIAIPLVALLIIKIKNLLNHSSEASQKSHASFFANLTDIENRDVARSVTQDYKNTGIEAVEMEDATKKSAIISRAEVTQMLTIVRSHRA